MVNEGDSAAFRLSLQQSLLDPAIVEQYQQIFKPMLAPIQESLKQSNLLVDSLRKQLQTKDEQITSLRNEVTNLKVLYDELEQHGRRGSMCIFGVPEHTTGTVDDKVLCLINKHLKVSPPLVVEDIEVAHRLGKPPPKPQVSDPPARSDASADDSDQQPGDSGHTSPSPEQPSSPPRSIIVKFASRRTKAQVMRNKKNLKDNPFKAADGSCHSVYIADDLTKRRAQMAYQARQLKRAGLIQDTWTFDSKILVKDSRNRILPIMTENDLSKFRQSSATANPTAEA